MGMKGFLVLQVHAGLFSLIDNEVERKFVLLSTGHIPWSKLHSLGA